MRHCSVSEVPCHLHASLSKRAQNWFSNCVQKTSYIRERAVSFGIKSATGKQSHVITVGESQRRHLYLQTRVKLCARNGGIFEIRMLFAIFFVGSTSLTLMFVYCR
jgi:hypothetical protein